MHSDRPFPVGLLMRLVVLVLPLVLTLAVPTSVSYGYWGYGNCCGWQETWSAWSQTWHGPNALETPLRGYFIPRMPGRCDRGYLGDGCVEGVANPSDRRTCEVNHACSYPPQAGVGFEPVEFERLGQVPNDMDPGGLPTAEPPDR
jgi:hypothetical protein